MAVMKYRDPETGQWVKVGMPKGDYPTRSEVEAMLNGSVGMQMDLLWENAFKTSDFEPQTINLDLSIYRGVIILYSMSKKANDTDEPQCMSTGFIPIGVGTQIKWPTPTECHERTVTTSKTGVTFTKGLYFKWGNNTTYDKNASSVPFYIYGIK